MSSRPKKIQVQLLENGKSSGEPISLPVNGRWEYTWESLDMTKEWTVQELPVAGYRTERIERDGNTWIITNTPVSSETSEQPERLPQTGQLWWPVPVLLFLGLGSVVLGIAQHKGKKDAK